jgi:hypothetical protein
LSFAPSISAMTIPANATTIHPSQCQWVWVWASGVGEWVSELIQCHWVRMTHSSHSLRPHPLPHCSPHAPSLHRTRLYPQCAPTRLVLSDVHGGLGTVNWLEGAALGGEWKVEQGRSQAPHHTAPPSHSTANFFFSRTAPHVKHALRTPPSSQRTIRERYSCR